MDTGGGEREKLTKGKFEMEIESDGGGRGVLVPQGEEELFEEKPCSLAGVAVFAIGLVETLAYTTCNARRRHSLAKVGEAAR